MYLEHFGLKTPPFSTTPDPSFFYPSSKHKEALACLLYAVEQRKGFALVTGEIGAGKSTLCRTALDRFGERVDSALLVHTSLTPKQLFLAVCAEFNLPTNGRSKIELVQVIKNFLVERKEMGRTVVLIVDEAQNLGMHVLEEVRLLGNLETSSEKLVQIVLVGQPELRRTIASPELRQLNQRITVKFHLGMLGPEDVAAYVDHRLAVAGAAAEPPIFEPDAKHEIFQASGGVPRLINVLCDQALLQAYISDERSVKPETVRRVIADMEGYYMDAPAGMRQAGLRAH